MTLATLPRYSPPEIVRVRDLDVAIRRQGEGAPLLYLHGAGLSGRWLPLHDMLSQSFDVIAPDHPGFGDTPRPGWLSEFADLALHYADLLDTLGTGKVHLAGHGLGGWIAAEIAAFYPERVRTLCLIAPSGLRPAANEHVPDLFRLDGEALLAAQLGADAARWRDTLVIADPLEARLHSYHEQIAEALVSWNPRYDVKLERRLGRVTAPGLVLMPEHEGFLAKSVGPRYADLLPNARLQVIKGRDGPTEHMMILQEPGQTADAIAGLSRQ